MHNLHLTFWKKFDHKIFIRDQKGQKADFAAIHIAVFSERFCFIQNIIQNFWYCIIYLRMFIYASVRKPFFRELNGQNMHL